MFYWSPWLGRIFALALDHRHDSTFMVGTNHGIALPMTHLFSRFNVQGPFTQRPSAGNLSSAITSTCIAFFLLLLTAHVLPKCSLLSVVRINMLTNNFIAYRQLRGNLLKNRLHAHQIGGLIGTPRRAHSQRFCFDQIICLSAHRLYWGDSLYQIFLRRNSIS